VPAHLLAGNLRVSVDVAGQQGLVLMQRYNSLLTRWLSALAVDTNGAANTTTRTPSRASLTYVESAREV
jgi:hypothetical protein